MRFLAVAITAAGLLSASTALAAETKSGKGSSGSSSGSSGGGQASGSGSTDAQRRSGTGAFVPEADKSWELSLGAEYHRLIVQNDLGGAGAYKSLLVYFAGVQYDVTPDDRLKLRGFLTQKFLADEGETGVRSDDTILSYRHRFHLSEDVSLNAAVAATAPTSFYSQKASLITSPSATINPVFKLGHLTIDARLTGGTFLVKYRTTEGGAPNPKWRLSMGVEAEYAMPFHEDLSVGASLTNNYRWAYGVGNANASNGTVDDVNYPSQPMQQSLGGEVFVRYDFPTFGPGTGFHLDVSMAYAQGDASLGFNSVLHDGVSHSYFFWRQTSQVYGVLTARY